MKSKSVTFKIFILKIYREVYGINVLTLLSFASAEQ